MSNTLWHDGTTTRCDGHKRENTYSTPVAPSSRGPFCDVCELHVGSEYDLGFSEFRTLRRLNVMGQHNTRIWEIKRKLDSRASYTDANTPLFCNKLL